MVFTGVMTSSSDSASISRGGAHLPARVVQWSVNWAAVVETVSVRVCTGPWRATRFRGRELMVALGHESKQQHNGQDRGGDQQGD
jgi:hypothetical protein